MWCGSQAPTAASLVASRWVGRHSEAGTVRWAQVGRVVSAVRHTGVGGAVSVESRVGPRDFTHWASSVNMLPCGINH